jgi:NADP-dependent 3-hydroxy acid dehydrogenase YdfG
MAGSLDRRRVLITGGSSGIGEATALAMAAEGAAIAVGARRKERLDELAGRIEGDGGTAVAIEADVTDEDQAKALVEGAAEALGGLDCIVNNAGVMLLGPLQGADPNEWRTMIEVNCLGLLYCTHYALPLMRDGGGGDVVNVSSVAGRTANLGSGVYNMTKWGVVGYSEALRQEALHIGVRVTLIEPGFVETELQSHNTNPIVVEQLDKMRESLGDQALQASDIANAIVYATSQPKHVSVNEILVRPTGQSR